MSLRRCSPTESNGYTTDLRCDRCGQPAEWRNRVVTSCCLLGEALCDACESDGPHLQMGRDTFWRDVGHDVRWLFGTLTSLLR